MTPGQTLRAARRLGGLSLAMVKDLTNLSPSLLSDIERDRKRLSPEVAEVLETIYGEPAVRALALDGRLTPRAVEFLRAHPIVGVMLDAVAEREGRR